MKGGRWAAGIAVAALVAAVGWSAPGGSPGTALQALAGSPAGTAATTYDGPRVAVPWTPGTPQLGIQIYWNNNPLDSAGAIAAKSRLVLDHAIGLGANSVVVSFPFFTDTISSSAVHGDARTPSPERLSVLLAAAKDAGLRVTLRPLLDETNLSQADIRNWRGTLRPANPTAWFASYEEFLTPYLAVAQEERVDAFVLGAELNAIQGDPRWAELAGHARARYRGEITYSANWDVYGEATTIPVDTVGLDAYPQLDLTPDATAAQMQRAWTDWLGAQLTGPPGELVLHEVGAAAEAETLLNPALPEHEGAVLDESVQRRWFDAACVAVRELGLGGLYWWRIDFHADPLHADPDRDRRDSFLGRQAEGSIRECFAAWGAER